MTSKNADYQAAVTAASSIQHTNKAKRQEYLRSDSQRRDLREKMLADLRRVFEHPENPYKGFAASRQRYRHLGHYPEILVVDLFGNHAEFLRAAELADSRGTTKVKNLTARLGTERKIQEYAEANVFAHVGRFDDKVRNKRNWKGLKQAIVVSDLHSRFLDPFAWRVALCIIHRVKPDLVVVNGDAVDFPKVGRFLQMPGATSLSLQDEIDFTRREIFGEIRRVAPDATIAWHIGNHEYRLIRYLADSAPALADLRCLGFAELFGVEEFGIEMVFGNSFLAPQHPKFFAPRQKDRHEDVNRRSWRIYWDSWAVTHGRSTARFPAAEEVARFGVSGTSGHTHRPQLVTAPTAACPTASWMSTGMLASFAVGQHYVEGPTAWTMGLGYTVVNTDRKEVIQEPILIHENWATWAGQLWRPTKDELQRRQALWD